MLPMQSFEATSPPRPGPGGLPSALDAADAGESRQQKPKTLPCKYCSKRFRRVEHVQRHERTHTKEKPFSCGWDRCGKTFGRRDLLVRHEKLVHLNENSKENSRPRRTSSNASIHRPSTSEDHAETNPIGIHGGPMGGLHLPQPQLPPLSQQSQPQQPPPQPQPYHHVPVHTGLDGTWSHEPSGPARGGAGNLDLLSDAALASEVNSMQPIMTEVSQQPVSHTRIKSFDEPMGNYSERPRPDQQVLSSNYTPQHDHGQSYDDYNLFLDDFASTSHFLPTHFEPEQHLSLWARSPAHFNQRGGSRPSSQLPSRFGSLAPDARESDLGSKMHEDALRSQSLRISVVDHTSLKNRVEEFSGVLPNDFVFPSRHTLTRFLEGYMSGFHDHLPFLHLPTLSPADMAPELLLAVLAVGAKYRFESTRGHALWYAAKTVATEQIRRRHSSDMHALLPNASAYSPHSTRPSPSTSYRHSFASAHSERPVTQDTYREPYSPNTPQARLETIQAVLLLFAIGLWGAKTILHEALSLQSNLAILIREEGLDMDTSQASIADWESWIRVEGAARTKLIAYCFFNLCSIAYDMPPLLLTSEVKLFLPSRSRLWRAESAWQWQELRQATPSADITVHEAFSRLLGGPNQGLPTHLSAFGNYVLIHALIQHVYLLKQTSLSGGSSYHVQRVLRPEDVEEVTQALRVWQTGFEQRHDLKTSDPGHLMGGESILGGSLAYNATALLRLGYIRLYTDVPPTRSLETRDAAFMASTLNATPLLLRSIRLHRAVFQAVHALSMLVKAGVNYVARTKSTEWSIQHSLCNFECAVLLSKWLLTLAAISPSDPPVSPEERNLLEIVRRMLDETEFAVPVDPSLAGPSSSTGRLGMDTSDSAKLRQLASAVVRLWGETFKGTHIFDVVQVMGSSLDRYADMVEKPKDRSPPARMAVAAAAMP